MVIRREGVREERRGEERRGGPQDRYQIIKV